MQYKYIKDKRLAKRAGFVAAPACRWARSNASSGRERSSADISKA